MSSKALKVDASRLPVASPRKNGLLRLSSLISRVYWTSLFSKADAGGAMCTFIVYWGISRDHTVTAGDAHREHRVGPVIVLVGI